MPLPTGNRLGTCEIMAMAILILAASPALAEPSDSFAVARPYRTIAFTPNRADRCAYYFVTEFSASVTSVKSQDRVDRFLFTDAMGLMRNVGHSQAAGLSIDSHLAAGGWRFAPTLRFKQWLAGRRSLDLSLGYASANLEQEGVVGPIVDLRYSPNGSFYAQAGACRIRNVSGITYYPQYHVYEQSLLQVHAGIGLGGVGGVVS